MRSTEHGYVGIYLMEGSYVDCLDFPPSLLHSVHFLQPVSRGNKYASNSSSQAMF